MALETGTYIDDLDAANPTVSDNINQGDDHLRLIKSTILATFPNITGAVTATHTEINAMVDDYVEGTYVATATPDTSGTITLTAGVDTLGYTKVGNLCHVQGRLQVTSVSSPVGNIDINLPFTSITSDEDSDITHSTWYGVNISGTPISGYPANGPHRLIVGAASTSVRLLAADQSSIADNIQALTDIYLNFTYLTV